MGGARTDLHRKVEHRQHPGDRDHRGRPGWRWGVGAKKIENVFKNVICVAVSCNM